MGRLGRDAGKKTTRNKYITPLQRITTSVLLRAARTQARDAGRGAEPTRALGSDNNNNNNTNNNDNHNNIIIIIIIIIIYIYIYIYICVCVCVCEGRARLGAGCDVMLRYARLYYVVLYRLHYCTALLYTIGLVCIVLYYCTIYIVYCTMLDYIIVYCIIVCSI